ncbi:hypothetical protein NP493_2035g00000 [Ridgeia piscesae]|uniref:Lipase domain-containing protein n=1 Tax=Ridgeia piscesae TaxID=27915 RepID=A0AAD9N5L1_RIDPI|nr:hypothetical protein NP493_2035g00000 [Ridgeia piscesae]
MFGTHTSCCVNAGCFSDAAPFNHLPVPKCPDQLKIQLTLFTRQGPKSGVRLTESNIPSEFHSNVKTIFVAHGWASSKKIRWVNDMKRELLKKGDFNFVQVLWHSRKINYAQSAADTRSVGAEVSNVAKQLVAKRLISPSHLWCIGHSLGSHVCGHTSRKYRFARITALDPAGPLFDADDGGLAKTDAAFVDVIHTNGNTLGTLRALGHVDFYPNKGGVQPACKKLLHIGENYFGGNICSHQLAQKLFTESINSPCKFRSDYSCRVPTSIPGSCTKCESRCQTMGYDASPHAAGGIFYLTTNSAKPYCK